MLHAGTRRGGGEGGTDGECLGASHTWRSAVVTVRCVRLARADLEWRGAQVAGTRREEAGATATEFELAVAKDRTWKGEQSPGVECRNVAVLSSHGGLAAVVCQWSCAAADRRA